MKAIGFRFRLHSKGLPGKPDIVLPRYKTVIFVHGCCWHRHRGGEFQREVQLTTAGMPGYRN